MVGENSQIPKYIEFTEIFLVKSMVTAKRICMRQIHYIKLSQELTTNSLLIYVLCTSCKPKVVLSVLQIAENIDTNLYKTLTLTSLKSGELQISVKVNIKSLFWLFWKIIWIKPFEVKKFMDLKAEAIVSYLLTKLKD